MKTFLLSTLIFLLILTTATLVEGKYLTPLMQFKLGIPAENIECRPDLQLVIKAKDGSPACVRSDTKARLLEIGWATTESSIINKEIPTNATEKGKSISSKLHTDEIDLSKIKSEDSRLDLSQYYYLAPLDIEIQVPQYDLPLKGNQISNFDDFSSKIVLSDDALEVLGKNGFVVIDNSLNSQEEDITAPYIGLNRKEVPIFVTTDSLLHLYHIQFDETLRQIEETEFYDTIWQISKELLDDSVEKYQTSTGDLKEAAKRNVAYFAVGLSLLEPKPDQVCGINDSSCAGFSESDITKYAFEMPDFVADVVRQELDLIDKHEGFVPSPIFKYEEDYSQYVPRGHYTRSEQLENYFKDFMWYGRITYLIKGDLIPPKPNEYEAKIQTLAASLMASEFEQKKELREKWDRIYSVTAFYVGLSDDLGPYQYIEALDRAFGGSKDLKSLEKQENLDKLKIELAKYQPPKINGGTGNCIIGPVFTIEAAENCLDAAKGLRLMGQRFIPDSYVFSELVNFDYKGSGEPFTLVYTDVGPIRGFPRGLDAMAILGSERAMELLSDLGDTDYKLYDEKFAKLQQEFDGFDAKDWNKNLYWSWLYSLKSLLTKFGDGYPTFMQSQAWEDKELTTALASWSQLRHDTILYAKQSYTFARESSGPPPLKPVVGYVEPVPEFYNRLLALTKMTNKGLDELKVLDESSKQRLNNLESILDKLAFISQKELENQELSKEDYDFIKNFGDALNDVISEVDEKAKKTTIIADVHTDANSRKVLEEGTGYVKLIVVAYKVPDGRILVGAGPVFSYYEFKHPMADRLTDEKWRELLSSSPPEQPEWIANFAK